MDLPDAYTNETAFHELPVVKFFENRPGWTVEELSRNKALLEPVPIGSFVGCGDGREVTHKDPEILKRYMLGPKIFGAISGVSMLVSDGTRNGISTACDKIKSLGFFPASHGDNHHDLNGCGQNGVWEKGKYPNLPPMQVTREEIKEIVSESQGAYVNHQDDHAEKYLDINLVPNTTQEPDGQKFHEDLWFIKMLVDDNPDKMKKAMELMALTIENLSDSVRTVRIIH